MKNLTKIFMAVVAGMFAFSCVTDATVDQTVQLGNEANGEGHYTLTLSLGDTNDALRTELGEKVGTEYPVKWCEDDVVAVNGTPSTSIELANEKGTAAVFTFSAEINRPYHVVYPAAVGVEAVAKGCYPVTFLSTQYYTEGTFCEGAAPMCGYATEDEGSAIEMQHLTSVLRFLVKGSNKLTSMTITAENGVISGNYDVNCQTGEVTPHDDARNDITVSFGEGLQLSDEATPVYVTVPAGDGNYGILAVKLRSAEGVMTVKVNTTAKPLTAGKVREFNTPIVFVPGEESEDATVFEIANEADMATLKNMIANNSFYPYTSARVVADVTMPADWTPIEGFSYTFDGGNNAIKGLKAPLFSTVEGATIKNVKLTDVAINETTRTQVGSLVCYATNSTIENCSAAGTFTYNNSTFAAPKNSVDSDDQAIAGIVGVAMDTTVKGCTNSVDVTITSYYASTAGKTYPKVAGVVGLAKMASTPASVENFVKVENCTNLATITSSQTISNLAPCVGGVVGCGSCVNLVNLTNGDKNAVDTKGAIKFTVRTFCPYWGGIVGMVVSICGDGLYNYGKMSFNQMLEWNQLGGVIGNSNTAAFDGVTLKNAKNYGTVEAVTGSSGSALYMGGIMGRVQNNLALSNCENYGTVRSVATCSGAYRVGGVFGDVVGANATVKSCKNGDPGKAPLTVSVIANQEATNTTNIYVGGIMGWSKGKEITSCSNHANVTISGSTSVAPFIGGIAGYTEGADSEISGCQNYNNTDTAESHISISMPGLTTAKVLYAGGLFGRIASSKSFTNCTNNCAIKLNVNVNGTSDNPYIGGVAGQMASSEYNKLHNGEKGDITVNGTAQCNFGVGGITTSIGGATGVGVTNCSNAGDIYCDIVNGTAATTDESGAAVAAVGGSMYLHGLSWVGTNNRSISNFTNSGNITFNGKILNNTIDKSKDLNISGATYTSAAAYTYSNIKNTGTIKVGADVKVPNVARISGVARTISTGTFTSCVNEGQIIYEGVDVKAVLLGGIAGDLTGAATFSGCYNSGHIQFKGAATSTNVAEVCVGGAIGKFNLNGTAKNLVNKGSVTVGGTWKFNPSVGGVIGYVSDSGAIIEACHNGDGTNNTHTVKLTASKDGFVGGIVGNFTGKEIKSCTSYGTVTAEGAANTLTHMVGGIVGQLMGKSETKDGTTTYTEVKLTSCVNHANVSLTGSIKNPYVGGVVGNVPNTSAVMSSCSNGTASNASPATISINATAMAAAPYLGGVAGYYNGKSLTACHNHANVALSGVGGTTPFVGGVVGVADSSTTTIDNCDSYNTADTDNEHIKVSYTATATGALKMGGIAGVAKGTTFKNCNNNSEVYFAGVYGAASSVSGLVGEATGSAGNAENQTGFYNNHNEVRGKITVTKNSSNTTLAAQLGISAMSSFGCNGVANCSNAGDIYCDVNNTASIYICAVSWYKELKGTGFTNSGNITFNGNCGNELFITGGGYTVDGKTCNNMVNTGDFTIDKDAVVKNVYIGGLCRQVKNAAIFNNCRNEGNVVVETTDDIALLYIGGIAAHTSSAVSGNFCGGENGFINTGDVTCTSPVPGNHKIGGVIGNVAHNITIKNATVNCNIQAWEYTNLGMIMGTARTDARKAMDCSVAGTIDKGQYGEYSNDLEELVKGWYSASETLTADNFHKYIYGAAVEASVATGDGCTCPTPVPPTPAE